MSAFARRAALTLGLAALAAGCAKRGAAAPAPANGAPPPGASPAATSTPGYVLWDLPAIKRAVHGSGHPVLVHFWASWCGPCLEELPLMEQFSRDAKAGGVELVSLSLDDPTRAGDRVVRTLAQSAPSLTRAIVSVDDQDAFIGEIDPRWEGAIPAIFAYDSKGQLRGRLIGEASRRDLDGLVARLKPGSK